MYIRTHRLPRAPIAPLILVAACALATTCCIADEPPIFSPPTQGGAFAPRGHFVQSDGAALYRAICQGCHMPDARGARGAGTYPALAANPKLASAAYPAVMVLGGRRGMPAFGDSLSDDQVAEVVNYVRSHFANRYADTLTPDEVARLRASLSPVSASP